MNKKSQSGTTLTVAPPRLRAGNTTDRAQTTIGFVVGVTLFLGAFAAVILLVGGDLTGAQIDESDRTPQADSTANYLVDTKFSDPFTSDSKTLDSDSVDDFFSSSNDLEDDIRKQEDLGMQITLTHVSTGNPPPRILEGGDLTRSTGDPTPIASSANKTATLDGELVIVEVKTWP